MGIETKYDYIYYTILGVEEILEILSEVGAIDDMMDTLTIRERHSIWINSLNKVFKDSKDYTINNFRVDSAQYCDDIKYWCRRNMQHKDCPVFVKYNDNQPIKIEGEGHMFYLYQQEEADDYQDSITVRYGSAPDTELWGSVDGLAGAGGRL